MMEGFSFVLLCGPSEVFEVLLPNEARMGIDKDDIAAVSHVVFSGQDLGASRLIPARRGFEEQDHIGRKCGGLGCSTFLFIAKLQGPSFAARHLSCFSFM
ncbi:MAG: hypothetical protein ACYSR6_13405 [Planctomycetota bacterium]